MKTEEGWETLGSFWWRGDHEGVQLGFTSAEAGNLGTHVGDAAAALRNRQRLETQLGLETGLLRLLNQVHSADVVNADAADACSGTLTADAWVSVEGAPIAVLVADCLPVLFVGEAQEGRRVTAAAHAGRHGLIAGILENTVTALRSRGAESITAWIGPGACGGCYEVPQQMFDQLTADRPALASTTRWGTPALDLRAEATAVLERSDAVVIDVPGCTIEHPALFSHRRSQKTGEAQGRIAGLVWT